jgi:hypothetical protein
MSTPLSDTTLAQLRVRDRGFLAPAFNDKVSALLEIMEAEGHDPVVFETLRLPQVQAEYFRRGTSRQKDVRRSMHGHGLAVDIISLANGWNYSDEWKADLQRGCERLKLTCGGLWKTPVDWPHVQWGTIPGAVPEILVRAFNEGGLYGTWATVGALR